MSEWWLGNLDKNAIPLDRPIVLAAVSGALTVLAIIIALMTYYRKWGYLWREWITSLDHKKIGIMYITLALIMLLRGFSDAIMMRVQQALAVGPNHGYLGPDHFNQIFGSHGTIMIIFVAMPFLVGLMNIAVPQQIGARDVAFPFVNAITLWLTTAGAMLVMVSLAIGEWSPDGWSGYAPLTEKEYSPGVGVDYWTWAFQAAGIGSTMTGINFLVTILKMRAPGLSLMRMPMFCWTTVFTNVLMIFAFPVLTVAFALIALDRYAGTHFFSNTMGGNSLMWINLWWIWGHPEVYILILPAFGVFSEVVATFSHKRLFGYRSMVYATATIMVLSFSVWLHHFFTMGAGPNVNSFFSLATMLIAVPTGVKIFNWAFTMYRGRVHASVPMYWTMGFLTTFAIGGMSGVLLAMPPADFVLHNSLFLIAHFHNVLIPGALFGYIAGYNYWFPKAFGFTLNEAWGKRAFWCWIVGFYLGFMPLYMLGFMGMPRRMQHYEMQAWHPYLLVAAGGVAIIGIGILLMMVQLWVSIRDRHANRDITGDPWDGHTLEWSTSSPAPEYNFAKRPTVEDLHGFKTMKEKGRAYERPDDYPDILMPKNTAAAFFIGVMAFSLGFCLTWHIWPFVVASALAIVTTIIMRSMSENTERIIPKEEISKIEKERYRILADLSREKGDESGRLSRGAHA